MNNYIGKTFDAFCEDICSVCICSNDMCSPLEKSCRLMCDMEDLKKFCDAADELRSQILHLVQSDDYCFSSGCEDF